MRTLEATQATLRDMLTYQRPHGSVTERQFIARYIVPTGAAEDEYGNWVLSIALPDGSPSRVLWSCHTDTVHRMPGRQRVRVTKPGVIKLARRERSNCLGADDTVGVYLAIEMIRAKVPGVYVFHYGEEVGCIGSGALAQHRPAFFEPIDYAIAFDRKGYTEVITHQCGRRTASDAFAKSMAKQLNQFGLKYQASDDGVFTDTENYADFLPECTNLSVGYFSQHSQGELVDSVHVWRLTRALCAVNESMLVSKRKPGPVIPYHKPGMLREQWRQGEMLDGLWKYADSDYAAEQHKSVIRDDSRDDDGLLPRSTSWTRADLDDEYDRLLAREKAEVNQELRDRFGYDVDDELNDGALGVDEEYEAIKAYLLADYSSRTPGLRKRKRRRLS